MINKVSSEIVRKRIHARVREKISGTAECPRLSVFRSNSHISVQLIDDEKGITLASSSTQQIKIKGSNIENATKVGKDIASKAKKLKITNVVFDRGGYLYHGRVKALADAAREEGLVF